VANWDVFQNDRLEVLRSLTTEQVRSLLARGEVQVDDLARPAGSAVPWTPITDLPDLAASLPKTPPAAPAQPPAGGPPTEDFPQVAGSFHPDEVFISSADGEESAFLIDAGEGDSAFVLDADDEDVPQAPSGASSPPEPPASYQAGLGELDINLQPPGRIELADDSEEELAAFPLEPDAELEYDPQEEDEEAAGFTLSRTAPNRVEELDLAAMVDVAFQMVLFFLVTSMTLVFKTLELPKSKPDKPPGAVGQGQQPKNLDDLIKNDYILVEINPKGEIRIDHELASPQNLVDRLRVARKDTGRKGMLLSADFATPHRNAVLAYDAANEIGLSIAIAKPAPAADAPLPPAGEE